MDFSFTKKPITEINIMKTEKPGIFTISRTYNASVDIVFNKWINTLDFTYIIGPKGSEMTFITSEVKEGGKSHWKMKMDDESIKYGMIDYKVINKNRSLIYVQNFCDEQGNFIKSPFSANYPDYLLTTIKLVNDSNNLTSVTMTWEIYGEASDDEIKTFESFKLFMIQGWNDSFDKLDKLLK